MTQMVATGSDQRHSDLQYIMLSALLSALIRIHLGLFTSSTLVPAVIVTALTPKLPVDRLQSSLEHGIPEAFAITVGSASTGTA